ncbi:MAG: hypothetical protein Kow0031_07300 [Anaerolineae bacterium]
MLLAYVAWALVITAPLAGHLFSHIPRGSEEAATVPWFNLWTLQRNVDQLLAGFPNYWNAPIFYPTPGAFALSEPQPLTAWLAAPLWLFSPPASYNFIVILFLTLNGWFAFCLLRQWRVPPMPASLAGLLLQSLPFVAQEMGVLQLLPLFGWLWSLLFLSRLMQSPGGGRWRNVVGLALGLAATFLTCGYYGLFSLMFLPLAVAFLWPPAAPRRQRVIRLLLAGLLAGAMVLPVLWPQRQILAAGQYSRPAETIRQNSAGAADYTRFLDYNLWYGQLLGLQSAAGQRLFPGLMLVSLAGIGLMERRQRRIRLYLLAAILLAGLLSLGLRLEIGGWQPYQLLQSWLPGFEQLRSPYRFAAALQVHLALLAGFGLWTVQRRLRRGTLLAATLAAVALLEMVALPLPLQPLPPPQGDAPWQQWLNGHASPPAVALLPFANSAAVAGYEQTVAWMLQQRGSQWQMVNGYSGFFPPYHAHLRRSLAPFPTADGVRQLRALGAEYVVVHYNVAGAPSSRVIGKFFAPVFEDPAANVIIYRLND